MDETQTKILIIMRHGERIDCAEDLKINEKRKLNICDPELTKKGISQAQDIGCQIVKRLELNLSEINLFISPFTRTIMTALNVGKEILKKHNSVKINYYIIKDLSEFLSKKIFHKSPFNDLLYYNQNKENKKNLYEELIKSQTKNNFEFIELFNDSIKAKYPENFKESIKRYNNIIEKILTNVKNISSNNSINIIVSHGYGVQIMTEYILETDCINGEESLKKEIFYVDYCTSYCFNIINNKLKYIGDMNPSE
jgi:broad specificity phosphatase PhoE